jgi:integrase
MTIRDLIKHYNELLKADGCAARIYLDGARLQLQATLPPALGSQKDFPHQQRIALRLAATAENLEIADRKARILGKAIAAETFDWADWVARPFSPVSKKCAEWIALYEEDFFDKRSRTPQTLTTFADHLKTLKKLPQDKILTAKMLKETLLSIPADTRSRQKAARVLKAIGELAGLPIDFSSYSGSYGLKSLEPREIPCDQLVEAWREQIDDPAWQAAYELLAAYGLRPHELAHLDLDKLPELTVTGGKSKARIVYPCPARWFGEWAILGFSESLLPRISGKDNSSIGNRVTHAFKRLKIPFKPYDLRHAWAIRAIGIYDPPIAAAMMGHSLTTHNQRYHRWLNSATLRAAYEAGDEPTLKIPLKSPLSDP